MCSHRPVGICAPGVDQAKYTSWRVMSVCTTDLQSLSEKVTWVTLISDSDLHLYTDLDPHKLQQNHCSHV